MHPLPQAVGALLPKAMAVHVQGMVLDVELINVSHHFLHTLKPWVAELKELITVEADQVIMLPVTECPFVLRLIFPELVAHNEVAFEEQIQGIVHRGTADTATLLLHTEIDLVGIQVVIVSVDLFEDGESLWRLPLTPLLEESGKDAPDLV
jgi:hypothetical protein